MEHHYRTLGLRPPASLDEVRTAYRRVMRSNHPDLAVNDAERAVLDARAVTINVAYQALVMSLTAEARAGRAPKFHVSTFDEAEPATRRDVPEEPTAAGRGGRERFDDTKTARPSAPRSADSTESEGGGVRAPQTGTVRAAVELAGRVRNDVADRRRRRKELRERAEEEARRDRRRRAAAVEAAEEERRRQEVLEHRRWRFVHDPDRVVPGTVVPLAPWVAVRSPCGCVVSAAWDGDEVVHGVFLLVGTTCGHSAWVYGVRGTDMRHVLTVSRSQWRTGTEVTVGRTPVPVPAMHPPGELGTIRGRGRPGRFNGPPGDLIVFLRHVNAFGLRVERGFRFRHPVAWSVTLAGAAAAVSWYLELPLPWQ